MSVKERTEAERTARALWNRLDADARWGLGDALVLGTFDWRDYWERKPPAGTLRALDQLRMDWEDCPV